MASTGDHRNYASGHWGKGNFDIKQLAERYGLDRSNQGRTEHDIYANDADGNEVYIGRSNMGMASNPDLVAAHSAQRHPGEGDHLAEGGDLDSVGDIRGAILNQWNRGAVAKAEPEPEPRGTGLEEDVQRFKDTRLQNPENQAPRQTFTEGPGAAQQDAVRYGEDINSHYINKFIPSLEADARLTAQEIGESGRYNLNRFIGTVPKLGDPKDLFDYYSDKIKESA